MFHDAWPSNPPNWPTVDTGFLLPLRGHRADILECETCVVSLWIAGSLCLLWFTHGAPAFVARHLTCRCENILSSAFDQQVFLEGFFECNNNNNAVFVGHYNHAAKNDPTRCLVGVCSSLSWKLSWWILSLHDSVGCWVGWSFIEMTCGAGRTLGFSLS